MKISFFKIFTIFAVVSSWAEKALADGKVTLVEALQLIGELAAVIGVNTLFEIPASDADVRLVSATDESAPVEVPLEVAGSSHLKQGKNA